VELPDVEEIMTLVVPELTPDYLLKVTGCFMGIYEKGIPFGHLEQYCLRIPVWAEGQD